MNRNLLCCIALFAVLSSIQWPTLAQDATNPKAKPASSPSVVISEVCYWPKKGEAEWVELANVSDKPVDIKGWQLVDGQSLDFVVSEKSLLMPSMSYLIVKLDGTGKMPTPFNQSKATTHSPRGGVGNLLGDKGGQIALYSPEIDVFNPSEIRSYVAWGRSPGKIVADAVKSEHWSSPADSVLGSGQEIIWGPGRTIQQGGSIGLIEPVTRRVYAYNRWGVFAPSETNQGETGAGKRGPILTPYAPDGAKTDSRGYRNISVIPVEDGVKYQFQVCSDRECTKLFLEHTGGNFDYRIEKPIPANSTYFWRARLIYPNGVESQWSEVRSLSSE